MQELVKQIYNELSILSQKIPLRFKCISEIDENEKMKINANKSPGFNILLATPLNFINLFTEHEKILSYTKFLILDECDKYFESSFLTQI